MAKFYKKITTFIFSRNLEDLQGYEGVQEDINFRKLELHEHGRLNEVYKLNTERLVPRMKRGDVCWVGEKDGKLVCYFWMQVTGTHRIGANEKYVKLSGHDGVIYHGRVAKELQGKGMGMVAYFKLMKLAREMGLSFVWGYVDIENIANHKSLEKAGFKRVFKISTIFVLNKVLSTWKFDYSVPKNYPYLPF